MKKLQKILMLMLAAALICSILPMVASANGDFRVENGALLEYTGGGGNITIPDSVSVIGDGVFRDKYGITGVTIGPKVKIIDDNAFHDCKDLVTVSIADAKVGDHAFDSCEKLKTVSIGGGKIGYAAFDGCKKLETVVLGKDVTELSSFSFAWCQKLKAIEIPEGITTIPDNCFYRCDSLASVKFPTTLKTIGGSAFWNAAVKEVYFHPGLEFIDDQAFTGTENLTDVWLPDTVTSLGYHAFDHTGSFYKTVHGVPGSYAETYCATDNYCVFVGDYNGKTDDPADEIGVPKDTIYDNSKGKVVSKNDGTVTITPVNGQIVDKVYKNGSSISFSAGSDGKVILTGIKKTDVIQITFKEEGKIGLCKDVKATNGGTFIINSDGTISMYPEDGYKVEKITVNGKSISFGVINGWTIIEGIKTTDVVRITFGKVTPVSFTDVPSGAWYEANVKAVAERGIIAGYGNGKFGPDDNVTIAQTARLAAAVHASLSGSDYDFSGGNPWYYPNYDYLCDLGSYNYLYSMNPEKPATRQEFAEIMQVALKCLSSSELSYNTVENGAIPDMAYNSTNECVYALYRAGIVVGDSSHKYNPKMNITRGEVAAIVHRFLDKNQRQSVTLTNSTVPTDLTGYNPKMWSWTVEGEGYGLDKFTSGKYVRGDGKAVLYIESSDSPDFMAYQLYVASSGGKKAYEVGAWGSAEANLNCMDDFYHNISFEDKGGHKITVTNFWLDAVENTYSSPDGVYYLVREKK